MEIFKNKYATIVIVVVLIITILYFYKKIKELMMRPTIVAPSNQIVANPSGGGGASASGGSVSAGNPVVVSISDDKAKDYARKLKEKIEGLTWWEWDNQLLKDVLSLSDYDLARVATFYLQLTSRDLADDLEGEQTGLFSPTGANARKIIERLRNLKK